MTQPENILWSKLRQEGRRHVHWTMRYETKATPKRKEYNDIGEQMVRNIAQENGEGSYDP